MASSSSHANKKLRVFFIPFFATGHLIPMTDLARLFAAARPDIVDCTMVVTPANAALIAPTLAGTAVNILTYPFPCVGLGAGIENLGSVSHDDTWRIYRAVDLAQPVHEALLREHQPNAIVADIPFSWATGIASELGIPRITFHAVGVFPQLVMNNLFSIRSELLRGSDPVVEVPGLPPGKTIRMPKSELPEFLLHEDHLTAAWDRLKSAQLDGFGVVVNTYYELEQVYCDMYRRVDAKRAYFVGPVAEEVGANRGGEGDVECIKWLGTKPSMSVVYVCFGSWAHFSVVQLRELALGLETSGKPFLWVVRGGEDNIREEWMPDGWEERVQERGMLIRGWAPQVAILQHSAVGVFVTHCGWNSVLEAVTAGVPVLTWPLVFEQFINERMAVEVAGIGERVWENARSATEAEREIVPSEVIGKVVSRFMEPGGAGEKDRVQAKTLAANARAAVAEGGSSYNDLRRLIDDLLEASAQT